MIMKYLSIKMIDCLVGFYGISTIIGYLMPNSLYTYQIYMTCKNILLIRFLNEPEFIFFFCMQLNGFKYCDIRVTI